MTVLESLCAVLFDFDYTLADSSTGVVVCVGYALEELGLPTAPREAICHTIGLSLAETLRSLAGEQALPLAPEFSRLFMHKADDVMVASTVLLAGVPALLTDLRGRGLRVGIVSSKYAFRIAAVMRREGLLDAVDTIVGGEDVAALKPAPDGLLEAMSRLGTTPETTLYVGDSVVDAVAARSAGVPFVGVLSGTTPAVSFGPYPRLAVLEDATALVGLLDGLMGRG